MQNQNIKIGYKFLCKLDCWTTDVYFVDGVEYVVCDIRCDYVDFNGCNDYVYFVKDDNKNMVAFEFEEDFDVFFYTKKEMRNMKLKKLYEG